MIPRKKNIAIIGAGNAACITAMHYYYHGQNLFDRITIYHDPNFPIERVGQGATLPVTRLLYHVFGVDWYNQFNFIRGTRKNGILYENWGKKTEKNFHPFPLDACAIHFVPQLLSKLILNCGLFDVVEKNIQNPEEEIDADYIFDCRGRHNRNEDLYESLTNPLNSVILGKDDAPDLSLHYTKCVATPDGWTFVIPNHDSVSYGYLFNNKITDEKDAAKNLINMFGVIPDGYLQFKNYIAKNFFDGERTIFNGNRGSFLEPLEATSVGFYLGVAKYAWDHIVSGVSKEICNQGIRNEMFRIQNFVLWHYQFGSKYNTSFWNYAKSLNFLPDEEFNSMIEEVNKNKINYSDRSYSQWPIQSFKKWIENT